MMSGEWNMEASTVANQIRSGSEKGGKTYAFNDGHDPDKPADFWFQNSEDGLVLFIVFFTQACRWSRCLGCNLPGQMASFHVPFGHIMAQVDYLFGLADVVEKRMDIRKVIVSNNGSVLDQETFSSTALMYLMAKLNLNLPNLSILSLETRPEFADFAELEFLSRALKEGETPTALEIAIGFEAFDDKLRNEVFDKGLTLSVFETFLETVAPYGYRLKTYFMQKPVPGMSDDDAVRDISEAIFYLGRMGKKYGVPINMHLNPTYAARGTVLEAAFKDGSFTPPFLTDVARAALSGKDAGISIFIGLSDEGLAVPGGSFVREGDGPIVERLESFNRTQDYSILERICQP
jgi:radical SAM enzyme (TIGR01210 family)